MADTAVLGYWTLMDVVNEYTSLDAFAQYIWAAEILNRKCPLVKILPLIASNNIMSNIGSKDSYLPTPTTRRFNEGILPTAGHTTPYSEPIMMMEDYSEVDYNLWKIQPDPTSWRQGKDKQKVEGFTQALENMLIYGSLATNAAGINGLTTRFNAQSYYPNGDTTWFPNVLSAGGVSADSGAFTSIWLVEFGEHKVYGIYPKNLPGGLEIEDLGKVTKEWGSQKVSEVLRTHFSWFVGLVVEDERCVQRMANVDTTTGVVAGIFDENLLIDMVNHLPGAGDDPGTVVFVNRTIKSQMDKRAVSQKLNTYFTQDEAGDVWGRRVTRFQGIPVMVNEKILSNETTVS